jgi:hypothetical protein
MKEETFAIPNNEGCNSKVESQNVIHGNISPVGPSAIFISYENYMEIYVDIYPCLHFAFSYFHCRCISFACRLDFSQVQYPGYVQYMLCQAKFETCPIVTGKNILCFKLLSFSSIVLRKFSPRAELNKFCNQEKLSGFALELLWLQPALPFCEVVKVSEGQCSYVYTQQWF